MDEEKSRLTSLDRYGKRLEIIPAEVKGFFRKYRTITQSILIAIFLLLPWIKINGSQALLIDIVNRNFSFFGLQFWSHDGPLIFFVLGILTLGLATITAVWGRVWCGWGCPQTVFVDAVYRRIERLVEGGYIARRQLKQRPLDLDKAVKYTIKWILFFVVSSLIAHSFVAYFVGAEKLMTMIQGSPQQNWNYFLLVSSMTVLLLFDFGWFREQFCIIACPYAKFQSVLMDANSVTVLYDERRGEPRKGSALASEGKAGDCVSCQRCVQVCPTGIDIRNGVQLECIACTACIDACDEIMTKVNKPKGLIRYASLYERTKFFRPRVAVYLVLICIFTLSLGFNLTDRAKFFVSILRGTDTPYQILNQGDEVFVLNHFKAHLHNQSGEDQSFQIFLKEDLSSLGVKLTMPESTVVVRPSSEKTVHFFVLAPKKIFDRQGKAKLDLSVKSNLEQQALQRPIVIIGPEN